MRFLTTVLLALTIGCNNGTGSVNDGTCVNSADCPDNFLCLEEVCVEIGCSESSECALGYFCDATYTCTTGCSEDLDCVAGETCDEATNTCGAYGCRDTQLDCSYGEYCDQTTGECYPESAALCNTCDVTAFNNTCGDGTCSPELGEEGGQTCSRDNDCADGYSCDLFTGLGNICHIDYCAQSCNINAEEPCSRGFTCASDGFGNYCFPDTGCDYLVQNNLLP